MKLMIGFAILTMGVGIWGLLTRRNLIKIVLSLSIAETGLQVLMISIGYIKGRTAPILDSVVGITDAVHKVVDPVPQALVLTAIVIGVAVDALMLSYVIRLFAKKKSLDISDYRDMKW